MYANSRAELLNFGDLVRLKFEYLKGDHFVITPGVKRDALALGAKEVSIGIIKAVQEARKSHGNQSTLCR